MPVGRLDIGLDRVVHRRAELTPDRCALRFEGRSLSYAELSQRVSRLANVLFTGGVAHRTRVGFLGKNHPVCLEALFATAQLGAIFVPLNHRLTALELARLIDDAGVHTLIVDDEHRPVVDSVREDLRVRRLIGSESGGSGWEPLPLLIEQARPATRGRVEPDDVALIMYTSGTAGQPRGAMLTHANLHWNNDSILNSVDFVNDEVTLAAMPLFHIGGLNVNTILTLQKGGTLVLHRDFDPGAALRAIAAEGVTQIFAVPAIYAAMLAHPDFRDSDLSSIRLAVVGGAPVPAALLAAYLDAGVPFVQGYGLTETSPVVSFLMPERAREKIGSAGLPVWMTEVRIADPESGEGLEQNEPGEIHVRGPNVMRGYWGVEEPVVDDDGWFHTGDVGYLDDEGFLFVVDRIKDLVISGGENVYPAEIESVLARHPEVLDVAVIGVPDATWGEAVMAVVVPRAGCSPSLESLREFAESALAPFKLPTYLRTVDGLPRNVAGKVLKVELRRRFDSSA